MRSRILLTLIYLGTVTPIIQAAKFNWDAFDEAKTNAACSALKPQCEEHCRTEATWLATENLARTFSKDRRPQTNSSKFKTECLQDCQDSANDCSQRIKTETEEKQIEIENSNKRKEIYQAYSTIKNTPPTISVVCNARETKDYHPTSFTIQVWTQSGICKQGSSPYACTDSGGVITLYDATYEKLGTLNRVSGTYYIQRERREASCKKSSTENYKF